MIMFHSLSSLKLVAAHLWKTLGTSTSEWTDSPLASCSFLSHSNPMSLPLSHPPFVSPSFLLPSPPSFLSSFLPSLPPPFSLTPLPLSSPSLSSLSTTSFIHSYSSLPPPSHREGMVKKRSGGYHHVHNCLGFTACCVDSCSVWRSRWGVWWGREGGRQWCGRQHYYHFLFGIIICIVGSSVVIVVLFDVASPLSLVIGMQHPLCCWHRHMRDCLECAPKLITTQLFMWQRIVNAIWSYSVMQCLTVTTLMFGKTLTFMLHYSLLNSDDMHQKYTIVCCTSAAGHLSNVVCVMWHTVNNIYSLNNKDYKYY